MKTRCFVDANGHIWSIDQEGESNFPGDIQLLHETVQILGAKDCLSGGREIAEEYQLWPSLTSLALAIEQIPVVNCDGSMSLEQAVAEAYLNVQSFETQWLKNNAEQPDHYPMSLPSENAGVWFEQIHDHAG